MARCRFRLALVVLAGLGLLAVARPADAEPGREAPSRGRRRLALLVAISRYSLRKLPAGKQAWVDLHCQADALALRDVLTSPRLGFAPGDVLVLRDQQATRDGIVSAFRQHLIDQAQPGDAVVFYFAGHGQQLPEAVAGNEIDGLDESLVPFDNNGQAAGDAAGTNLRDDDLAQLLRQVGQRVHAAGGSDGGNVTVILDCCCSGSGTRGAFIERGRGWDEALDGPRPAVRAQLAATRGPEDASGFDLGADPADGTVALAACESDQTAKELELADGAYHGAFSYNLVEALRQAGPQTTYDHLLARLAAQLCAARVPDQTPLLEGRRGQRLFGGGVADLPPTVTLGAFDGSEATLPLGELHGVTAGSVYTLYPPEGALTRERRLAEMIVTSVRPTTCRAALAAAWRGKLDPLALRLARAIETAHNYAGQSLRLLVAPADWRPRLLGLPMVVSEPVTAATCDVQLLRQGGELVLAGRGVTARGEQLDVLARFPDTAASEPAVRRAVQAQWRWQMLARLQNGSAPSPVALRVVPVQVELAPDGQTVKRLLGRQPTAGPDDGRGLRLRAGEYITVEVRNTGPDKLHVAVLDLSPDGAIAPVFPHPDRPGENVIPNDGRWRAVPTDADPSVFRLNPPLGRELFKAIATRERVDFSLLAQRAAEGADRGRGVGFDSPLALLFGDIAATRGPNPAPVSSDDWSTAEAVLQIVGR